MRRAPPLVLAALILFLTANTSAHIRRAMALRPPIVQEVGADTRTLHSTPAQTGHIGPESIYPDPVLTPGDVFPGVTADDVCVPGYARSARAVTREERAYVLALYGVEDNARLFEVDHFISLELGGSNASINLWPEPYDPTPGALEKDVVENYLHDQVCAGLMALPDAQAAIAADWYAVYLAIPGPQPAPPRPRPNPNRAPAPPATPTAPLPADLDSIHTWYTSGATQATTYYCDDDPDWQKLSPRTLQAFPSVASLLTRYPNRYLHRPCLDGATGP